MQRYVLEVPLTKKDGEDLRDRLQACKGDVDATLQFWMDACTSKIGPHAVNRTRDCLDVLNEACTRGWGIDRVVELADELVASGFVTSEDVDPIVDMYRALFPSMGMDPPLHFPAQRDAADTDVFLNESPANDTAPFVPTVSQG